MSGNRLYPIYAPENNDPNKRFLMGTEGIKPLLVIGLNPSRADKERSDRTITRITEYARRNHSDSFIMTNLYAQRTPFPLLLHLTRDESLHRDNINHIAGIIRKFDKLDILAAWGEPINIRSYLKTCLSDIYNLTLTGDVHWLQISEALTKSGHPRHPSRGSYSPLMPFDIKEYVSVNFKF